MLQGSPAYLHLRALKLADRDCHCRIVGAHPGGATARATWVQTMGPMHRTPRPPISELIRHTLSHTNSVTDRSTSSLSPPSSMSPLRVSHQAVPPDPQK